MNTSKTVWLGVRVFVVLVVMVLARACLIPRVSHGSDARLSILTTDLQCIRAQLELYKNDHDGSYPANITAGLTKRTNPDGTINESGTCGPYLREFFPNPFIKDPALTVKTTGAPGEGWFYNPDTGAFRANSNGHEDM